MEIESFNLGFLCGTSSSYSSELLLSLTKTGKVFDVDAFTRKYLP
jgi:hypothetical protein